MHTCLKIVFKFTLHFSRLAMACFNSDTKWLQAAINSITLRTSRLNA